jgi:hypothetical protein
MPSSWVLLRSLVVVLHALADLLQPVHMDAFAKVANWRVLHDVSVGK